MKNHKACFSCRTAREGIKICRKKMELFLNHFADQNHFNRSRKKEDQYGGNGTRTSQNIATLSPKCWGKYTGKKAELNQSDET